MKKYLYSILFSFALISFSQSVHADDHASDEAEVFNLQVQLCTLKGNTSIKQYDEMIDDYVNWSRKHDVELFFARQTPLYPQDSWFDAGYDFMELLWSTHSVSGKGWDKWLGTSDGQKLNEKWQKLADCRVKQGAAVPLYVNQDEINKDNDRIVAWNWCSLNDGVSYEDLIAEQHESDAAECDAELLSVAGERRFQGDARAAAEHLRDLRGGATLAAGAGGGAPI